MVNKVCNRRPRQAVVALFGALGLVLAFGCTGEPSAPDGLVVEPRFSAGDCDPLRTRNVSL